MKLKLSVFLTTLLAMPLIAATPVEQRVLEIFQKRCSDCHKDGKDGEEPILNGSIDLAALRANKDYVSVAEPEKSPILSRLTLAPSAKKRMPKNTADKPLPPLPPDEIEAIRTWIRGGTKLAEAKPATVPAPTAQAASAPASQPAPETVKAAPVVPTEGGLNGKVLALFEKNCSECHQKRSPQLHARVDLGALRGSKFVDAGKPELSSLFKAVTRDANDPDRMPQSEGKPGDKDYRAPLTKDESELIRRWIAGDGEVSAARQFIGLETVVKRIHDDLEAQPESTRPHLRYLKLTHLYNLRRADGRPLDSDEQLTAYAAGLSKALNSLSWAGQIAVPKPIDAEKTIFRIDLREYGPRFNAQTWESIMSYYPYAIEGANTRLETRIKQMSGSRRAYVRADWFAFATTQPPLYNKILGLPDTEQELEKLLKLDTLENLRQFKAVRAAFSPSGVSETNRLVERHDLGSHAGGYWKSYDFSKDRRTDRQDLRLAPLGPDDAHLTKNAAHSFRQDGGEIIFNLPNGLQGYYLVNAAGKSLPVAPRFVVGGDANFRNDRLIINGISCIACHTQGLNAPPTQTIDTLADQLGRSGADTAGFEDGVVIKRLYAEPDKLRAIAKADIARFQTANRASTPGYSASEDPVKLLYIAFRRDLTGNALASELWSEDASLLKVLEETTDRRMHLYIRDVKDGIAIPRDRVLADFDALAGLLGHTLRPFAPLNTAEFEGEKATLNIAGFGEPAPQGRPVKPPQQNAFGKGERTTVGIPGGGSATLELTQESFKVGESIAFTVSATHACTIQVIHFGADGSRTRLVPNALDPNDHIRAGEKRLFPGISRDGKSIKFTTTEPTGPESIVILVAPAGSAMSRGMTGTRAAGNFQTFTAPVVNTRGQIIIESGTPTEQGRVRYILTK